MYSSSSSSSSSSSILTWRLPRLKLSPEDVEVSGPTIPNIQPDEIMMQTKTLEVDRKTTISDELWDQALVCGIVRLSMQHCGLTVIPEQVVNLRGCLQELELGSNNLHQLPPEIGKLVKLRKLNLLNNNLKELPAECRLVPGWFFSL